ncbi:MAG: hypothetical protein RQ875_01885 [Vicingaceae bacterium]|nr:hypothetical protein [Vicingaceae bacterium]
MKKRVLFVASLFLATATFAQDGLTSKKGEAYLPEAGDWALGFDAAPFIGYFGNLANGETGNSMNAAWLDGARASIVGKMFKDETTAYRGRVRLGFGSTSADQLGFYDQDADPTTNQIEYTNTAKSSNFNLVLGGGIEKRRGNTRIQGYYGGELLISLSSFNQTWDYGRDYTDNWAVNEVAPVGNIQGTAFAERVTERKAGSTFAFGLRGFVGVEWFIAPKVSLGAEYGWGLGFASTGEGEETIEYWGFVENSTATAPSLQSETIKTGGSSAFQLDTDNNANSIFGGSGQINLIFHF